MSDTIAAIATGNSVSAIGVIRMSGDDAIAIAERVFTPASGKPLSSYESMKLVLGTLKSAQGETLDHCLCTISRAPHSYTGENTAELQCHGSPTVLRLALETLFSFGARQARAGEFTKRAFLNGRMDLTQAEAVIDLIDSETSEAAKNAAGQLGGAILHRTDSIYNSLVEIISHYHAVLDYPDEDIEDFKLRSYEETLCGARDELKALLASHERGKILKSGVSAAIIGRPNAGKSSLLNALVGYDRAIVTSIPGTTRDTIEEKVMLGNVLLRLADTAGLRGTDDPVEVIGVDRAREKAKNAQLIIAVFDGSMPLSDHDEETISAALNASLRIAVINKCDLPQKLDITELSSRFEHICRVSALNKSGIDKLAEAVSSLFPFPAAPAGEILTNSRQAEAVSRSLSALEQAIAAMSAGIAPDAVLTQTEEAMSALGELTGRTVREDVTHRIFERFCVGK